METLGRGSTYMITLYSGMANASERQNSKISHVHAVRASDWRKVSCELLAHNTESVECLECRKVFAHKKQLRNYMRCHVDLLGLSFDIWG